MYYLEIDIFACSDHYRFHDPRRRVVVGVVVAYVAGLARVLALRALVHRVHTACLDELVCARRRSPFTHVTQPAAVDHLSTSVPRFQPGEAEA